MRLMPIPGVRSCATCGHRWFTAYVGAQECACCRGTVAAAEQWPHACASGHAAQSGGDCAQCVRVVAKETAPRTEPKEWRNRT